LVRQQHPLKGEAMRHLLILAQTTGRFDLSWLEDLAARALLVLQLGVTAILAVRAAADAGAAVAGGKPARVAAKEAIAERAGWIIVLWTVGSIVTIVLWVAGR
jgi:hypothetical protein